jgi:hypothetical protein
MTNFFSFLFYCVWPNLSLTSQSRAAHKTGKKSFFVWSRFTFITRHSRKKIRKRWQSVRSFELFQKGEFLFQRPSEKSLFSPLLFASCHLFSSRWVRENNNKKKGSRQKRHTQVSTAPKCLTCFPLSIEMMGRRKKSPGPLVCYVSERLGLRRETEAFSRSPVALHIYRVASLLPLCASAVSLSLSNSLSLFVSLFPLSRRACRITCHAGKELLWRTLFSPLRDVSDTLPHL